MAKSKVKPVESRIGSLIEIKRNVIDKAKEEQLLDKVTKSSNILTLIKNLEEKVKHLNYPHVIIRTKQQLKEYLRKSKIFALDSETTGLSPVTCRIVGISLFYKGGLPCYIPLTHVDYITHERLPNQITKEELRECLLEVMHDTKFIFHNSVFDIRFIENFTGLRLKSYWDTGSAGRLLNENEDSHKLKDLHTKYVSKEENSKFNQLFKDITFDLVPIHLGSPYASYDAQMTYELYEYQSQYLNPNNKAKELDLVYQYYVDVEIPLMEVVVDMEQRGVAGDLETALALEKKYFAIREKYEKECNEILKNYAQQCKAYNDARLPNEKGKLPTALDLPIINISSPVQLSVFLYDILKLPSVDGKRKTGVDELLKLNHPIIKPLLEYRGADKILSTFIIPMLSYMKTDGRIHGNFNPLGTLTNRFSSNNPNLQNIPSRNSEIRNIFSGGTTYKNYPKQNNYEFDKCEEVQLQDGSWKFVELLKIGDVTIENEEVISVEVGQGYLGKVKVTLV